MTVEVELPDGRTVEFPDGVTPDVIQRTTKSLMAPQTGLEGHPEESFQAGYAQSFPQPAPRPAAPPAPAPTPARGGLGDPGTLSGAVAEGFRTGPRIVDQPAIDQADQLGWLYQYGVSPLMQGVNLPLRLGNAAWKGGQATLESLLTPLNPILGTNFARDIAAMPEAFPTGVPEEATYSGRGSTLLRPPPEPPRPQFVSERMAPPRPPGMTNEQRIQQLVEHGVNEEQPAVGPPMARGPLTKEAPPPQPAAGEIAPPSATGARTTPTEAEQILASAKSVADQHYDIAKANGQDSSYTPASVGKMVDAVDSAAPQGPGERAVGGENAVTRLQRDMQPLRDQPLTLADVQRMDERMSDHITEEYRAGRKKVAGQLEDIQQKWREQADGVTADDVTGGQAGFQALDPARQAWSQYRKMSDVMLMKERADMTQNPTSSYKTAVKNFVTGRASRGWTDEEKAALTASADRGAVGGTLHLLGSRLLPHVGGAVGASVAGIPGFIAGEVVTHGMGAGVRNLANTMQTERVNRAMGVLGSSVPAPPTNQLLRY